MSEFISEFAIDKRYINSPTLGERVLHSMEDSARGSSPNREWRWWMGCEPHIRALREVMPSATANSNREVENLLQMCVSLYMAALRATSSLGDEHIYIALSGGSATAMEASFMWLGGWRPTAALLLVYSLMGVQLEDEIRNFGYGLRRLPNSSAVLSNRQLTNLTNVQKSTREGERKLSKKLANIQMLISDQDVLAAALAMSSSSSSSSSSLSSTRGISGLRTAFRPRMSRLKKLVLQADHLRLHTLHQLFLILTPLQVARCAIAAFELTFMMRELGNAAHSKTLKTTTPSPVKPAPESSSSSDPILDDSSSQPRSDALSDSLQTTQLGSL